jgi:hypothetical protein
MNKIWEDIPNRIEQNVLDNIIRRDMCKCLQNSKSNGKWEKVLGYTLNELKNHLESLFFSEMCWNNYGLNGWTIDHIIPCSFFMWRRYEDVEFQYCWSLVNLRPMWQGGKDGNSSKNNKMILNGKKIKVISNQ